jgi:hypothetical protein
MPYSTYCLFFVAPNKRLDPDLCSIWKWLIYYWQLSQDTNPFITIGIILLNKTAILYTYSVYTYSRKAI